MLRFLKEKNIKDFLRWVLISSLVGILAGASATLFLYALNWATDTRIEFSSVIYLLPFAGFFIGWIYHIYGKDIAAGNNLILEEIHDPKKVVPFKMAPFILLGTVMTHFFGGSAGREGTAVQMGASLADQLAKPFKLSPTDRKMLLMAGAGAGFGAAVGAPWAGVIFGMEVIYVGRVKLFAVLECFIASFVGYFTAQLLHAPHTHYPAVLLPDISFKLMCIVAICGVTFGLSARIFSKLTHFIELIYKRFVRYPPLKPFLGGCVLVLLYLAIGSFRYAGLGLDVIQDALQTRMSFLDPFYKGILTAITVGSGFKGGEFIPLVFIGATLGSALSLFFSVSAPFLASLGFAAVFAGASNTPIACTLMAVEIFGIKVLPYAFIACFMSYLFSGYRSIYSTQVFYNKKHQIFRSRKKTS